MLDILSDIKTENLDNEISARIKKVKDCEFLAALISEACSKCSLSDIAESRTSWTDDGITFYFAPKDGQKKLVSICCFFSGEIVSMISDRTGDYSYKSTVMEVVPSPEGIRNEISKIIEYFEQKGLNAT